MTTFNIIGTKIYSCYSNTLARNRGKESHRGSKPPMDGSLSDFLRAWIMDFASSRLRPCQVRADLSSIYCAQ